MSNPFEQTPNQEPDLYSDLNLDRRFQEISQSNPDYDMSKLQDMVIGVMDKIFAETDNIPPHDAGDLVGGSLDARRAVMNGLVSSLEHAVREGTNDSDLESVLFPISKIFTDPQPVVLDAMKRRTVEMEKNFMVSFLLDELRVSYGGHIGYSKAIDNADYAWVEISADNHRIAGITYTYRFYKNKPSGDNELMYDMVCDIHIRFLGERDAPKIISDDFPYFIESFYTEANEANGYKERLALDPPENLLPLLSELTKEMVSEATVTRGMDEIDREEKTRAYLNKLAKEIVEREIDPIRARDKLEKIGIYDDPEMFR